MELYDSFFKKASLFVKTKSLQMYKWYVKSIGLGTTNLEDHGKSEETIINSYRNVRSQAYSYLQCSDFSPAKLQQNKSILSKTFKLKASLQIALHLNGFIPFILSKSITLNINATFCSCYCSLSLLLNINFSAYTRKDVDEKWYLVIQYSQAQVIILTPKCYLLCDAGNAKDWHYSHEVITSTPLCLPWHASFLFLSKIQLLEWM